ncbi:hypothetical protein [Leucobacter sp. wl10]|uniref:hypothetical protein n=1 Tax=Leucobacter sp. wl10 TaxID=2304677 RepID=UPI000E5C42DA|nr:hypothetical protein [Leucobacter sp. wl10]RGE22760.1 hypothetical protein D1J51_03760 [Leucobacter sp. wl10]
MSPAFLLGLTIALGGALVMAAGSELQSQAVLAAGGRWRSFLRSPRWLTGLALLGAAVGTNFAALALTPVSAVQSVSIVALAASAAFGAATRRVVVTRGAVLSIGLCAVGILGFVSLVAAHRAPGGGQADPRAQLLATTAILAALTAVGLAATLTGRGREGEGVRLMGLVAAAAVFGSVTTVFKTLVELVLDRGSASALGDPAALGALGVVATGGVVANVLLQRSHRGFPAPVVVAAITIVDPLTAAVIGISVLGEVRPSWAVAAGLLAFGATACAGVVGVSRIRRRAPPAREHDPPPTPDAPAPRAIPDQ